jgi:hypothetical protein
VYYWIYELDIEALGVVGGQSGGARWKGLSMNNLLIGAVITVMMLALSYLLIRRLDV